MSLGIPMCLLFLFWTCLLCGVTGEMRFVCPRPQTPRADITTGPCGAGNLSPFKDNFMEVTPGLFTIQLEETVIHPGSPIRIALMEFQQSNRACVLLDHIPHNDAARAVSTPTCKTDDYPLGQCHYAKYYITVNIPDIDCKQCVLQMINVATDWYNKEQEPCYQADNSNNNCTAYYSCANIRIRPTPKGVGKDINSCLFSRLRLDKRWPYTPVKQFQIDMYPPFEQDNYLHLFERPDWTLEFELGLSNENLTVRSGSTGIFNGTRPVRFLPGYGGKLTRVLSAEQRELLHQGLLQIRATARFRNGTYRNFLFPIKKPVDMFEDNMYKDHGVEYSSGGFLIEKPFIGPTATFAEVNYPAGQCQAPGKESYGAVLTLYKSNLPRTLATFSITRDLMFGQFISSYELDRVIVNTKWNITDGQPKSKNLAFNKRKIRGFADTGSQLIRTHLDFTGGRRPTDMTIVVKRDGNLDTVFGSVQRGLKAEIKVADDLLALMFVTLHPKEPSFKVTVMVSNFNKRLGNGFKVSLDGPVKSLSISDLARVTPLDGEAFFYEMTVPIEDMEIAQLLWAGLFQASLNDIANSKVYTGKLDQLTTSVCEESENIACKAKILLTPSTGRIDRGAKTIPVNGLALVAIGDNQMIMDISISIQDLKDKDSITSVDILRNGRRYFTLPGFDFQPAYAGQNKMFAKNQMRMNTEALESLNAGLLSLSVSVNRPGTGTVSAVGQIKGRSVSSPGLLIPRQTVTNRPRVRGGGGFQLRTRAPPQGPTDDGKPRINPFGQKSTGNAIVISPWMFLMSLLTVISGTRL